MLKFREAINSDVDIYFNWANDILVRSQSYNTNKIRYNDHLDWYKRKLQDANCKMFIFSNEVNQEIGQVRIELIEEQSAIINISVDQFFRGKSYGSKILNIAAAAFHQQNKFVVINAFIKIENLSSKYIFEKAGFDYKREIVFNNTKSFQYVKYENRKS
jgi:RimJ/RimL family protein N-acetyltransferase